MDEAQAEKLEQERRREVSAVFSFLIALAVVVGALVIGAILIMTRPEPVTSESVRPVPTVVGVPLQRGDHTVVIATQGVVESRREVRMATQVGGRVVRISPNLVEAARVEEGEALVWIEKADFEAAVARAESALRDAELALEMEQARQVQALRDWEKLGKGEAPELVRRVPQIKSAKAKLASAEEELRRAGRDLERTTIRAPFAGRVRMAGVEAGAVVSPGTAVAEIYSDRDLEVRLSFPLEDFGFLRRSDLPSFDVRASIGGEEKSWPAELVRVDGEVDRSTLSGYGVARVLPASDGGYPPVGLFVRAAVPGEALHDVVEISRAAIRRQDEIWIAVPEAETTRIEKRRVELLRSLRKSMIARMDFPEGAMLVLTRLETAAEGDEVKVVANVEASE